MSIYFLILLSLIKSEEFCYKIVSDFNITSYVRNFIQIEDKLFFALHNSSLLSFDKQTKVFINQLGNHHSIQTDIILHKNSYYIISLFSDGYLQIMDFQKQTVLRRAIAHESRPNGFVFDANNQYIITYANDRFIKIFDFENLNQLGTLNGHSGGVLSVIQIDNILISGGTDKRLFIWDINNFKTLDMLFGFSSFIKSILYFKENQIFIGFGDGSIMIFDYQRKGYKDLLQIHENDVDYMKKGQFMHNGNIIDFLVSSDLNGNINIQNLQNLENIIYFKQHQQSVKDLQYLGNNLFASSSKNGNGKIWSIGCNRYNEEL